MCKIQRNCRNWSGPGIFLAFLFSCSIASSQNNSHGDTINKISPAVIKKIRDNLIIGSKNFLLTMSPSPAVVRDRNHLFFDSLKVKASKNNLTRKLYGFLVINRDTIFKKQFTGTSDANYLIYSGKKIRKITVKRLNVFGANIYNPGSSNPNKIENILNKTHFNTNENIIRKNLLFSEGQTISPLVLSDNERLLRQLPYIDDARIIVVPVSDDEADIVVYTKDVYSLGGSFTYNGLKKGNVSVFDKNIFGMGHEFGLDIPYNNTLPDSPGFGVHYIADNIAKSFINLNVYYLHGLGERTYGFTMIRKLVSFTTKYAGGISIRQMYTTSTLDTLITPAPLKYNLQDYWLSRSFLVNKESVSRIIIGVRYTNNNVFDHPVILPESFYNLQKYKLFLASAALSVQKYTKTNLLYSYGRTEDVPYGSMLKFTTGREFNEFKQRTYLGGEVSFSSIDHNPWDIFIPIPDFQLI